MTRRRSVLAAVCSVIVLTAVASGCQSGRTVNAATLPPGQLETSSTPVRKSLEPLLSTPAAATPHLSLIVTVTGPRGIPAATGDQLGYPGGLAALDGHELYRISLARGVPAFTGDTATVRLVLGEDTIELATAQLGTEPLDYVTPVQVPPKFAVAAPIGKPLQLRITDEGRDLVYDLRARKVDQAASTVPTGCERVNATPSPTQLTTKVPLRAPGLTDQGTVAPIDVTTELTLSLAGGVSDGTQSAFSASVEQWTPTQGWAVDGCWLYISGLQLSGGLSVSPWTAEPLVVNPAESITITPDGAQPIRPEGLTAAALSLNSPLGVQLDPIVVTLPPDSHSTTITFDPKIEPGQEITPIAGVQPVSATLTY